MPLWALKLNEYLIFYLLVFFFVFLFLFFIYNCVPYAASARADLDRWLYGLVLAVELFGT